MDAAGLENLIKPLLLKDLRIQCRQRGISPAGSRDELAARLKEHMMQTNDFNLRNEDGSVMNSITVTQLFGQASSNTGNNYVRTNGQNVGNFLGDRPSSRVLAAPGGNSSFSLGHGSSQYQHVPAAVEPATPPRPPPINTQPQATPPTEKMSFLDSMAAQIANKSQHKYAPTPSPAPTMPAAERPSVPAPAAVPAVGAPENRPPKTFNTSGGQNNNYHRPNGQNVGNFLTDKPSSRVLAPPGGTSSITFG